MISKIVLDDFFPDLADARAYALEHDFTQEPEYDGHKYKGFAPVKDAAFVQYVADLLKEYLNLAAVRVHMAAFTCAMQGFKTQQWIHCDNSCAHYAVVIHLHDLPDRGTAFWRHPDYGDALKTSLTEHEIKCLQERGRTAEGWARTDYIDSKLNRLLFYPTSLFHSRWPEEGVGETPEQARLTMVLFLDVA